jgi:hypothetical protein
MHAFCPINDKFCYEICFFLHVKVPYISGTQKYEQWGYVSWFRSNQGPTVSVPVVNPDVFEFSVSK